MRGREIRRTVEEGWTKRRKGQESEGGEDEQKASSGLEPTATFKLVVNPTLVDHFYKTCSMLWQYSPLGNIVFVCVCASVCTGWGANLKSVAIEAHTDIKCAHSLSEDRAIHRAFYTGCLFSLYLFGPPQLPMVTAYQGTERGLSANANVGQLFSGGMRSFWHTWLI